MIDPLLVAQRKKEGRGKLLTIFLILALLFCATFLATLPQAILRIGDWRYWSAVVIPLLSLSGIILMWRWIKLGVYLYYAYIILFLFTPPLLAPFLGVHTQNNMLIIEYIYLFITTAVLGGLMYLIFRRKWHLFA